MRRLVAAAIVGLPFDAPSRRALNETLCDWTFEYDAASTTWRRFVVCVLSLIGVARTIVRTVGSEITRIPAGWLVPRIAGVAALPAILLAAIGWGHVAAPVPATSDRWLELMTMVLPQATMALAPAALFLVVGRSSSARPVPAIGLAVGVFLTMIVAAAWVLPAANRQFHVTVYALASQSDIASAAGRLPETPADLSPPALVASAMRRPAGPGMGVLLFRTGLASLAAAFVVLGSAVSRLPAGRRRKWTAMLTTAYALGVGLMPSQWELGGHAPAVVGLIPWITAGWACVGAATLAAQPLPKET